jgi:hypothetical protein
MKTRLEFRDEYSPLARNEVSSYFANMGFQADDTILDFWTKSNGCQLHGYRIKGTRFLGFYRIPKKENRSRHYDSIRVSQGGIREPEDLFLVLGRCSASYELAFALNGPDQGKFVLVLGCQEWKVVGDSFDNVLKLILPFDDKDYDQTYTSEILNAIQKNYYRESIILLSQLKNFDDSFNGNKPCGTPLMVACKYGRHDIAHAILRFGANPNIRDCDGQTCLYYASQDAGSIDLIKLLDHNGVDFTNKDERNNTILNYLVSFRNNPRIFDYLVQTGTYAKIQSKSDLKTKDVLKTFLPDEDYPDPAGIYFNSLNGVYID